FLLLEDGSGRATFVGGEQLPGALNPRPKVLILAACHSESVLRQATGLADSTAVVCIRSDAPVEVTACLDFERAFFPALLRGESAGEAFDAAVRQVASNPGLSAPATAPDKPPPADKFRLDPPGRAVRLSAAGD